MKKNEKTNVMRILSQKKVPYEEVVYTELESTSGTDIAEYLGEDPDTAFKTLVTTGKTGEHYVFVIPVAAELDLKKAANAVGEKSIAMLPLKELLPLTGYVHGGCSPIGMKKVFKTVFHKTAGDYDSIYFSGGKVGYQVKLRLSDLQDVLKYSLCDVV